MFVLNSFWYQHCTLFFRPTLHSAALTSCFITCNNYTYTTHCTLHTTHYTLHATRYTLHTTHCTLHTTHYTLHAARCTLHATRYTLHTHASSFHCGQMTGPTVMRLSGLQRRLQRPEHFIGYGGLFVCRRYPYVCTYRQSSCCRL